MHCNLRPPDVAPVVLRFNYETIPRSRSTYPLVTYVSFTVDTLRYTVILTADPLTFNFCSLYDDAIKLDFTKF